MCNGFSVKISRSCPCGDSVMLAFEHGHFHAQANEYCPCQSCLRVQFGYFSIRARAFRRGFYRSIAAMGIDAIYRATTCPHCANTLDDRANE